MFCMSVKLGLLRNIRLFDVRKLNAEEYISI